MLRWGVESCGAGALSTVLQHYGDLTTMEHWDSTLPKTRGGVMTIDLLLGARQKGFEASLVTGDRAMIERELHENRPVILMLQVVQAPGRARDFFHYIVVDGIDPARGLIRTQFGDQKARWVTFERLENAWAGGGHAALLIRPRDADDIAPALRTAVALEDEGKLAEAASRYQAILAEHPDSAIAWTNLGNARSQLGERGPAEDAFRKALTIDPGARDAMNNLAWLLLQENRIDEAESLARKATALGGPDPYLVLDTLARVLAAKGACAESLATFRRAIASVPPAQGAARADIEHALADTERSCTTSS
jgi:tetratricopeptide (TPR) repeat protein